MKQVFLVSIVGFMLCAMVLYFLWHVVTTLYSDWTLSRELKEIEAEARDRKAHRQRENQQRLANGCAHDFNHDGIVFPQGVCSRCGLHAEKPAGDCDHVWRRDDSVEQGSLCEKCGQRHGGGTLLHTSLEMPG